MVPPLWQSIERIFDDKTSAAQKRSKLMRLYKMELYKLCHKKSFLAGLLAVLLTGLFIFQQDLRLQRCVINDAEYTGLAAVRMNRQITEEFKGVLTDDKVSRIVDKYGFPKGAPDNFNRQNGNFLNTFLMEYASDGCINGQKDYRLATKALPLAETELGQYHDEAGMSFRLEYFTGWDLFQSTLGVLMLGVSILILYIVSVVFSEEEQIGTKPLLFTTKEGPASDTLAKVAAAFSVSAGVWLTAALFALLLHITVYGTDGLGCIASLIMHQGFLPVPLMMQSIGTYLIQVLLASLLGILELCAITICVSAHCRSCFHAVVNAGIFYALPFAGFMLLQGLMATLTVLSSRHTLHPAFITLCRYFSFLVGCLVHSSPIYLLINRNNLIEIATCIPTPGTGNGMCMISLYATLMTAILLLVFCSVNACRRYRRICRV